MKEITMRIVVISNFNLEPHFELMIKRIFGVGTDVVSIPYHECRSTDCQEILSNADQIIVWINLENLIPDVFVNISILDSNRVLTFCKDIIKHLLLVTQTKILWVLFEDYSSPLPIIASHFYDGFSDLLNISLKNSLNDSVCFIDLKRLIAEIGIEKAFDTKSKYRWDSPYSKDLIFSVTKDIQKQYLIEKGITKKCLIVDCDNVLWGGILSEEGFENIKLGCNGQGRFFQDFQRFILSLYYHGVILAVCSKNDFSDVRTVFREHSEMILKEKHISCFEVNWKNKVCNIKEISNRLNIGTDSIVFVDDSPEEIEAVKAMLPDVTTILFTRGINYNQFSCFNLSNHINKENVEKRNETYRTDIKRNELKMRSSNYDEYIEELSVKTEIHKTLPLEYSRVAELTQRTNKCSNGKRFTSIEIKNEIESGELDFYSVCVSDKFSDLGLVGTFAIDNNKIVLFCLSCRALGRKIEEYMIDYIITNWKIKNVFFQSTKKNETLKELFTEKIHPVFYE